MKNVVFWDIKIQFLPHRKYMTSLLQSPVGWCPARFQVLTAVTTKNVVFWTVTQYGSCKNRRFEERIASIFMVERISEKRLLAISSA
jgi:hypothetical protein